MGSGRSEDSLHNASRGVEWNMGGGSKGRSLGVRNFLWSHDGLVLLLHLCLFLWLSDGLSCPCDLSHLPLLVQSPLWSLHSGEHLWDRSVTCWLSLFLDLSQFLSWSFSLDLWLSLSFYSVVCDFNSLSEIRSDNPSNCQRGQIPHPDRSSMTAQYHVPQSWEVAH